MKISESLRKRIHDSADDFKKMLQQILPNDVNRMVYVNEDKSCISCLANDTAIILRVDLRIHMKVLLKFVLENPHIEGKYLNVNISLESAESEDTNYNRVADVFAGISTVKHFLMSQAFKELEDVSCVKLAITDEDGNRNIELFTESVPNGIKSIEDFDVYQQFFQSKFAIMIL